MEDVKRKRHERENNNQALGINVDVEFQALVEQSREKVPFMQPHTSADQLKICVCIKKRPIFQKELSSGEIDSISFSNPKVICHENRYKVDGITRYIENSEFEFDNAFAEDEPTEDLYEYSIAPILDLVFNTGTITIFAYGQTGSGKTYTMQGL